jgi:hypothetical protein
MTIHELRIFELQPGVSVGDFLEFFQGDGASGLRAALRASGIAVPGMWRTASRPAGAPEEILWIREYKNIDQRAAADEALYNSALWKRSLESRSREIVAKVESIDMTPVQVARLAAGPRDHGYQELRHYRLAANALPRMLAFFEDVRRLVGSRGIDVLGWWVAEYQQSERFLWLRKFEDEAAKVRLSREIYESDLWLTRFKPRTMGVIEERILRDLEPISASRMGGHDPIDL